MTSTIRVPRTEITGLFGRFLKGMMRRQVGSVPAGAEVMWHHPRVFTDMARLGARTERWDQLDPQLASLAGMAAAAEIGCGFCLDFGYFTAHNKGLDEAKAREVPRWRDSDAFSPVERRVLEFAAAMCATPPTVTDELVAALLDDLGAPAVVELTARVGFMNLSARSNVALGIPSEEYATSCGLPPLAIPGEAARSAG